MNSTHNSNPTIDNQSRLPEIFGTLIIFGTLSTIFVIMRSYTRAKILKMFQIDDCIMVVAQILTIGCAVTMALEGKFGLGQHIWTLPTSSQVPYLKTFYASIIIYALAVTIVKLSILLQIRRIFTMPKLQKATTIGLVFMTCSNITIVLLLTFVCNPIATFWDQNPDGTCFDFLTLWYIEAIINIVTDFAIFCLPLPVISTLNLKRRQKIILFFIFSLGFFPCAISLYRIHTLHVAASATDPTWDNVDAATWSFIELTIAIVAACLPTLRPLIVKLHPRLLSSTRSNVRDLTERDMMPKYKSFDKKGDPIVIGISTRTDEVHVDHQSPQTPNNLVF